MGSSVNLTNKWTMSLRPQVGALLLTAVGFQSIFFSQISYATLNGMAVLNTFGKEKYIAALYVDEPTTTAESVMLQSNSAVMEFLIVDRSISRRSMARLWAESLAINADYAQLEKYADDLATLTTFIKGRLITGDKLRIINTADAILLELNDLPLGQLKSDGLFDLLLQTWIGEVPPSTQFRQQLLSAGDVNTDLQSRFDALLPLNGRVEQIAAWLSPEEEPEIRETQTVNSEASSETPEIVEATPEPEPEPQSVADTAETEEIAQSDSESTTPQQPSLLPVETPSQTAFFQPAPSNDETFSEPEEIAQQEPAEEGTLPLQVAIATQEPLPEEIEEVEEAFSAADLLAGQRYYTAIKNKIYRSVDYPAQALRTGREGDVSLDVLLDAQGELIDTIVAQQSQHRSFDREATRAVKRSAPFPSPPSSLLEDNLYQFKIVLRFKLNSE